MKLSTRFLIVFCYFTIYVLWASNFITIQLALESFPPFIMGAIRFIIGGIILYGISLTAGNRPIGFKKSFLYMKQGIILNVGGTGSLMWAEQFVPSGIASVIYASIPLCIMLMDVSEWRNNLRNINIISGIILGIVSVGILFGMDQVHINKNFLIGLIVLLFGVISWSAGTIYIKYKTSDTPIMTRLAIQILTAGLCLGIIGLVKGEGYGFDFTSVTGVSWVSLSIQILVGSIGGYLAYLWLLRVRPAIEVSTYTFVHPCVAILLGILIGGEEFTFRIFCSLVLILLAVFLVRYAGRISLKQLLAGN